LSHFRKVLQPFLPASCPEFDSWLVPIRSAVGFIGEASCPDDDGAILFTGSISPSHSKDWYQRFLHNDHSASAFAAEVVFNILPACTRSIVFGGVAFGVLERARRENDARGEAAAFVLTIGAMTNGLRSRVGINLESDGATQTRTLQMHVYKSSPGSIEFDVDLGVEYWMRGVAVLSGYISKVRRVMQSQASGLHAASDLLGAFIAKWRICEQGRQYR